MGSGWTVGRSVHYRWKWVRSRVFYRSQGNTTDMAQPIFTLSPEMQQSWDYVMGQMLSFVNDTNADVDMAYDFVCEQLDISSFVDNEAAWNDFYTYWEAADNRNCTEFNFAA